VETRLLVDSIEESSLMALLGEQRGGQIELETLGNLVLELDLSFEDVVCSPGLGEDETILEIGVLGLDIPNNGIGLGLATLDLKAHAGGCLCLDLERGAVVMEVLAEKVIGGLAEILVRHLISNRVQGRSLGNMPSKTGGQAEGGTW
jgi:hypothetical protein